MMCPVLQALSAAAGAVADLPVPVGLGAQDVLEEQVAMLAAAMAGLQRQLAVRMAALEMQATAGDARGAVIRAGVDARRAGFLRQVGRFRAAHSDLADAWSADSITLDQVDVVRCAGSRLEPDRTVALIAAVLPELPGLDVRATRRLVDEVADRLAPGDPDIDELTEHAARSLAWAATPGGGIVVDGYLPAAEADAFTAAIDALVESLRTAGDTLTTSQRRADALACRVAKAGEHGLTTGGGLPATMILTVSLAEAARVALRDPAGFATIPHRRPRGVSLVGEVPAGDATVRSGLCCAAVTPVLNGPGSTTA